MSVETDTVLSAIRRGEDSLPKLRSATGLEYAQLHIVLHKLEYEWRAIDSHETTQGFQRFTVKDSEALPEAKQESHVEPDKDPPSNNGHKPPVPKQPAQGVAYKAREMAEVEEVEEVMATTDNMAAGASKRGLTTIQLYTDEEVGRAVQRGRDPYYQNAPASTLTRSQKKLASIAVSRARSDRANDAVRAVSSRAEARRDSPKSNGRPRIEVDLQKFEDLLADPHLTINKVCEGTGIKRNLIYDRKDIDPEFGAAYQRGMERREQAIADGKLKTPEKKPGKKPETESAQAQPARMVTPDKTEDMKPSLPENATAMMMEKSAMAETCEVIPRTIPPQAEPYILEGMLQLHMDIRISMAEMASWPNCDIADFFGALAKLQRLGGRSRDTRTKRIEAYVEQEKRT